MEDSRVSREEEQEQEDILVWKVPFFAILPPLYIS